jgi:predicted chitinase
VAFSLTRSNWRAIFPKAPEAIIDAFVAQAEVLDEAGITQSRTRLAYALANVEHECDGFSIPDLTENIKYSAKQMAKVWPKRFASAEDVQQRFGTKPGWQKKAFDEIYGNRMGNRPGTSDGSTYIGRGGPQITGRDGYREVGKRCNLDLVNDPVRATDFAVQPAILAAFWSWKDLKSPADAGDFKGFVKKWNGGAIGMVDREERMAGNDPVIRRLTAMVTILPKLDGLS